MANTTITVNVAESQNYLATSRTISVDSQTKTAGYITLSTNSVTLDGWSGVTGTVTITSNSGGALSVASSDTSKVTASLSGTTITLTGVASGNVTITVTVGETSEYTSATATISVSATVRVMQYGTYGIKWTSNVAKGTRTDDAANLADPQPCVNGGRDGSGSSPFDYIYPWGAIRYVNLTCTDFSVGGSWQDDYFVEIPKFWFQMSFNSSGYPTVKISSTQKSGFLVSPAHRDRDGSGERDFVYLRRKASGRNSSIENFRTWLDDEYGTYGHQYDYAMHMTLFLLMIVEMGYTEMSTLIGLTRGGTSSGTWTYHTGTLASSKDTQGKIMYRHILDIWDYLTPLDGFYVSEGKLYSIDNPNDYLTQTNSRLVGTLNAVPTYTYGKLKIPFSGQNNDYFIEAEDSYRNNVYKHGVYYTYDTSSSSDKYIFRTLMDNNDTDNTYAPLFSIMLRKHDMIGCSGDQYVAYRCVFTPPNNYSHITSIQDMGV